MEETYVALLRGINVGRNKRVAMADLRALLGDLGYRDARTVLQSGNAVFTAPATAPRVVEDAVSAAIRDRLGLEVAVLVRTGDELRDVVAGNPLAEIVTDASRGHVAFFRDPLALPGGLDEAAYEPERIAVRGRECYLWLPGGMTGSPLLAALERTPVTTTGTVRTLRTVRRLAALLD